MQVYTYFTGSISKQDHLYIKILVSLHGRQLGVSNSDRLYIHIQIGFIAQVSRRKDRMNLTGFRS
jgi:hypothetical protein